MIQSLVGSTLGCMIGGGWGAALYLSYGERR